MSNEKSSRKNIAWSGIIFVMVMGLFFAYSNLPQSYNLGPWTLNKSNDLKWPTIKKSKKTNLKQKINAIDSVKPKTLDTLPKRFLLVGDSEVEGLMYPFYDYCRFNGDTLAFAHIWYSATDMVYAKSDSLKNIIEQVKPNHIVMVIGLNQVTQKNTENSGIAVKKIIETFGDIPYTWVGPANWIPDLGINDLYANTIDPGQFFYSGNLILERGPDGRHPSRNAYFVWMDSIAQWMQNESVHRIRWNKPDTIYQYRKFDKKVLNASRMKKAAKAKADSLQSPTKKVDD
jgi:hypothetical protein